MPCSESFCACSRGGGGVPQPVVGGGPLMFLTISRIIPLLSNYFSKLVSGVWGSRKVVSGRSLLGSTIVLGWGGGVV